MKTILKKPAKIFITLFLWLAGIFFSLGGLTYFEKSVPAATLMLILGVVLLPPTWKIIERIRPQILNPKRRVVLALILFIVAIMISPAESRPARQPVTEAVNASASIQAKEPKAPKATNQKENIASISYINSAYALKGTGVANENYTLKFSNGTSVGASTDNSGKYSVTIPGAAGVFGYVELTRDTNGFWFGGKQTYEKCYYALTDKNPQYSNDTLRPVLLGIGGAASQYEMSGYYSSGATLILKSEDKVLATTTVDDTGRYKFDNLSLDTNYLPVAVYEKVSTGWFSSKESKLLDDKYLDIDKHRILAELPTITKVKSKTESIPFDSQAIESSSLSKGETKVTQEGANGEKTITYRLTYKGNKEISREAIGESVTKQPTSRVTMVGTYVAPVYTPSPAPQIQSGGRTGAICNDGSHSSATGRGACSHHGGVAQWLYG